MTTDVGGGVVRFPTVTGRSLLGVELVLPREFPAERTLAVVAFRQWHQARVDRWIARAVANGVPPTPRGHTGAMPVAVVEDSEAFERLNRVLDALEDHEDVMEVFHNATIEEAASSESPEQ